MTYYVSSWMLNHTHSLTGYKNDVTVDDLEQSFSLNITVETVLYA